jgi:predicted Zn-ribbon and HTH transcriptional regulator
VWQDRKHDQKVRLESHFDRVDVNIVDKSGESKIVTKSKCKHCDYLFTTQVSKVKKRALCHLLKVELCTGTLLSLIGLLLQIKRALDHIDHIFGRAQLRCLQKDHAGQVHHLI